MRMSFPVKANIVAILLVMLCFACADQRRNNIEYIVYGTYAGECIAHCATMYKFEGSKLLVDTTDSYFPDQGKGLKFGFQSLDPEHLHSAELIKARIPTMLFESNGEVYGNPDGHDQGGIYIEFEIKGDTSRFYIDTNLEKIPPELRDYASLIMERTGFRTFN
jgi:hypothetical protein